jgi:tetratricopeptide (TPR) repeat protein
MHDGRYAEAEELARAALAVLDAEGQGDSATTALYADRLVEALLLGHRGLKPEAIAVARQAVALKERVFGTKDAETGRSLERLGRVLTTGEEYDEAKVVLGRALQLLDDALGPDHADVATARSATGFLLLSEGKPDEAVVWFEQARVIRESVLGASSPAVADAQEMIGTCLSRQGDFERAESHLRRALETFERALGSAHPRVAEALVSLGMTQNFNDAAPVLSELGYAHLAAAEWTKASQYFERSLAIYVRELGEDSRPAAEELLALGIVRNDMGDSAGAAALEARAAAVLERTYGPLCSANIGSGTN